MINQCSGDDLLKFVTISPNELEYMSTNSESILIHLEKYGIQNKTEMKK